MELIKLAVNKMPGHIPGGGFHYSLHPIAMKDEQEANIFEAMGYIIIEVPKDKGEQLLNSAKMALAHQMEVAVFAETVLSHGRTGP